MINKVYEKIKIIIKENYRFLLVMVFLYFITFYELPYVINKPGGIIDTKNKVEINSNLKMTGSLNMAYVSEVPANIFFTTISLFLKNWDLEKINEESFSKETKKEFSHLMLEEANQDAYICALDASNIDYTKAENKIYITYVEKEAKTNLKIGDQIIKVDNKKIKNKDELFEITKKHQKGDTLIFTVLNNGKKEDKEATLIDIEGEPKIGLLLYETYKIKSKQNIDFKFKSSESGGSGGLMMTLTLYSYLNNIDLTHGKKIVGTGTIDEKGNVGEISGIKYKILGASLEKADIFLVPFGNNYEEALKIKKKQNLQLEIVPVKTFNDALNYLKKL